MINRDITEFDIDMLGEIGNIGAGHAASALSDMLQQKILIDVTFSDLCDSQNIADKLGGNEALMTVTYNEISEALEGYIFFILNDNDVETIYNIAAQGYEVEREAVIVEITNIITGSYITALSDLLEEPIDQNVPKTKRDKLGSFINSIIDNESAEIADKTMIIGTNLIIKNLDIGTNLTVEDFNMSGFYVMVLKQKSLDKLLQKFNSGRK